MTDRSENELREAGEILGLEIDEQHHPEEVTARLFLLLARAVHGLGGYPAPSLERSSLQQVEEKAQGEMDIAGMKAALHERNWPAPQAMDPKDSGTPLTPPTIPPDETCDCCRFYLADIQAQQDLGENRGTCRWRPTYVLRAGDEWCGRFLRKPAVLP